MSHARDSAKVAAGHLRSAARVAASGGRRRTMAPIRARATRALQHIVWALAIAEAWEAGRQRLARKRALRGRVQKTITRLASEPQRRTNP